MYKLRYTALLLCLLFLTTYAHSLEIANGRIKLVLHENIGRFSLYYLSDLQNKTYLPLLLDQDPRTSVLSLVIGNKIYRMGEVAIFSEKAEETTSGARFTWNSTQLEIIQDFTFVKSADSSLSDGLQIKLSIKNISSRDIVIGVRFLFDTYLGEKTVHFTTDDSKKIDRETTILKYNIGKYWISSLEKPESGGLQVMTGGTGITVPDSIIFANWKRLNDASWSYETSTSRNFDLLPYSVNDSAVCHFYDPLTIGSGKTRTITLILGYANPTGFTIAQDSGRKEITEILEKAQAGGTEGEQLSVSSDLKTLNELIAEINRKLENNADITDRELRIVEQIIEELQKKYPKD